jgi:hypothetical protein
MDQFVGDEFGEALVDPTTPTEANIPLVSIPRGQTKPAISIEAFDNHTHFLNVSTSSLYRQPLLDRLLG